MRLTGQISAKGTLKGYISIATKEVIREANGILKMHHEYFKKVPATEPIYIKVVG